ncbi:MAG: DUF6491 family protein [Candidatus Binataceae bacterium]
MRVLFLAACFACASGTALLASGAADAADRIGESQMCIMSNYIEDTPVIDSHTILVRMNPGRGYKRIDLSEDCPSLMDDKQVSFATSINRLCVRDSVKGGPKACTIAKIVTIDADEARALMAASEAR